MGRVRRQKRPSRASRVFKAVVAAIALALAAVSCADLAAGNLLTGTVGLASAAVIVFLLRRLAHEVRFTRALVNMNARLLWEKHERAAPAPEQKRRSALARQIALGTLEDAMGRVQADRAAADCAGDGEASGAVW